MNKLGVPTINLLDPNHLPWDVNTIQDYLDQYPGNPDLNARMALLLWKQNNIKAALNYAKIGIEQNDILNSSYPYYVMSLISFKTNELEDAEAAIIKALEIDYQNSDYYNLLSDIYLDMEKWEDALFYASEGLEYSPAHPNCLKNKEIAIDKMKENQSDVERIQSLIEEGWQLLETGEVKSASYNFKEALKLNPQLPEAREGLIESVKAKSHFYKYLLQYYAQVNKIPLYIRLILVFALVFLFKNYAETYSGLTFSQSIFFVFSISLLIFHLTARALFDFLLLFDKRNRHLISGEKKKTAYWAAFFFVTSITILGTAFYLKTHLPFHDKEIHQILKKHAPDYQKKWAWPIHNKTVPTNK